MFERFTDRARRVLVLAREEARLLGEPHIGTEHLLLGLIREDEGIAAQALRSVGVTLEAVREKVEEAGGTAGKAPSPSPPFTPRTKKVLELSLREAMQLGHSHIGTEHLLLALLREGEGVGAQVLVSLGADLARVRQQVLQLMPGGRAPGPVEQPHTRVVQTVLAGEQPMEVEEPPWLRCSLCGRSLWETARFVVGAGGRACEECVRAGSGMLDASAPEHRELALPPRVAAQPLDDALVQAVVAAIEGALGRTAGPAGWATHVEEPARFEPLLSQLGERWGRSGPVRVTEVGLVNPQLAHVRFQLTFDAGREVSAAGQLRRHESRWAVTAETLTVLLRRAGVDVPPIPPAPQ